MAEQRHVWNHTGTASFCMVCGTNGFTSELCPGSRPDPRAENARLREREDKVLVALAEAIGAVATTPAHTDSPAKYVRILAEERDSLQARVEEAERVLGNAILRGADALNRATKQVRGWVAHSRRYRVRFEAAEALAERRKEALDWYAEQGHWRADTAQPNLYRIVLHDDLEEETDGRRMAGKRARAAIEEGT